MMHQEFLNQIKASLMEDRSSKNRRALAKKIVKQKIDLSLWLGLLEGDKKLATRFLWLLGDICEANPSQIFPILPYLFDQRDTLKLPGVKRSISKWLWLAGVPPQIEGLVLDEVLKWLMDKKIKVAVKCYSLEILVCFAKQYPEIISEVKLVIAEQIDHNSIAFKARCKKIVPLLNKIALQNGLEY